VLELVVVLEAAFDEAADDEVVPPHPERRRLDANSVSERTLRRFGFCMKNLLLIIAPFSSGAKCALLCGMMKGLSNGYA